jgi:hypothetical protein
MERVGREIRRRNLTERMFPAQQARHDQGVRTAIDPAGRPRRGSFLPLLSPQTIIWQPTDAGAMPVARPGRATLILARAEGAPSGGNCTITLTWESATQGITTLDTVQITNGTRFGQQAVTDPDTGQPGIDLPAGAWVLRSIAPASGATGISVALVIDPR